jgi:hypothetical protein
MPTLFPGALDTNTELGGGFINASPVVNPFVNIDAAYRNNSNGAMFAVQARIGILGGSLVPTSIDWGLLGVGGTPNQGLQFNGGGAAAWPGLGANTGIFLNSGVNVPSFHRAAGLDYDLVAVGINDTLQNAYNGGNTIVTAGGDNLSIGGSESVIIDLSAAAANYVQINSLGGIHTGLTFGVTAALAAGSGMPTALITTTTLNAAANTSYGSLGTATRVENNINDGCYFYGYSSECTFHADGPAGPGTAAWSYDFLALNTTHVGAGNFNSVGLFVSTAHTYGIYMSSPMSSIGIHMGAVTDTGIEIGACDIDAINLAASSDCNLRMGAADTWDIYTDQSKVKFNFNSPAADTFYLDADAVANGRTTANGLMNFKWKAGNSAAVGVYQRVFNNAAGTKEGGTVYWSQIDTRNAASAPLTSGGIFNAFQTSCLSDAADAVDAEMYGYYISFSFENAGGGGSFNTGPIAAGVLVHMPESLAADGHYHNNDGNIDAPSERWAIKVGSGETSLRRTFMEGPTNLGKSVLRIHQADVDQAFATFDGTYNANPSLGNLATKNTGPTTVVGPGVTSWAWKGMARVHVEDDAATFGNADYWIPVYTYTGA